MEYVKEVEVERTVSGAFLAVVAVALLSAVGALGWCYFLQKNVTLNQQKLAEAQRSWTRPTRGCERPRRRWARVSA